MYNANGGSQWRLVVPWHRDARAPMNNNFATNSNDRDVNFRDYGNLSPDSATIHHQMQEKIKQLEEREEKSTAEHALLESTLKQLEELLIEERATSQRLRNQLEEQLKHREQDVISGATISKFNEHLAGKDRLIARLLEIKSANADSEKRRKQDEAKIKQLDEEVKMLALKLRENRLTVRKLEDEREDLKQALEKGKRSTEAQTKIDSLRAELTKSDTRKQMTDLEDRLNTSIVQLSESNNDLQKQRQLVDELEMKQRKTANEITIKVKELEHVVKSYSEEEAKLKVKLSKARREIGILCEDLVVANKTVERLERLQQQVAQEAIKKDTSRSTLYPPTSCTVDGKKVKLIWMGDLTLDDGKRETVAKPPAKNKPIRRQSKSIVQNTDMSVLPKTINQRKRSAAKSQPNAVPRKRGRPLKARPQPAET